MKNPDLRELLEMVDLRDPRVLAMGAFLVGTVVAAGGASEPAPVPVAASTQAMAAAPTVRTPAPAPVVAQAARAVLDGVGVESGVEQARVGRALAALDGKVARKSDPAALRMAVQAYYAYKAENPEQVKKPYLYYVDYGLNARTPRGYVFDMETLAVVDGPFHVAHGRGSRPTADGIPTRFSNREGTNSTSLGLYLAQETYAFRGKSGGKRYTSPGLRLKGLSGKYNSEARARGIVVHGAPYVSASKAGRSEGCPAVDLTRARKLIPLIANGGMVFHFSPRDRTWMQEDRWAGLSRVAAAARG